MTNKQNPFDKETLRSARWALITVGTVVVILGAIAAAIFL